MRVISGVSIRGRILAAMLLASVLPMAIIGAQGYHCAREAVVALSHDHLVSMLRGREASIREWFGERIADLAVVASLPPVIKAMDHKDSLLRSEISALLSAVQDRGGSFEALVLYDAERRVLGSAPSEEHGMDTLSSTFPETDLLKGGGPVLGAPHVHPGGSIGMHAMAPIVSSEGRLLGFLAGNLNLTRSLTPLLQDRSGLGRSGKVYLAQPDGLVVTEPFSGQNGVSGTARTPLHLAAAAAGGAPEVLDYRDYSGVEVLGAAAVLPFSDWMVVAEIDRHEALHWLVMLMDRLIITVSVTLVLVSGMAFWITWVVGKPLKELLGVAQRIRGGHTAERVPPLSGTEAEEVRVAFNLMLDELQRQQGQLVKSATLASIGELTASIVHEMRNPLSSVKINTQALYRALRDDRRYAELGEISLQQIERLDRMLTDLLSYGRPVELHLEAATARDLFSAAIEVTGRAAEEKGVRIAVAGDGGQASVLVDREQMQRALSNLIGNAIEATPAGGEIRVAAISRPDNGGVLELEICDSGPGLSESALERAFEPFFTTKINGTGLGLANVSKIAELHGGSVAAGNLDGGGARFAIRLPQQC